MMTMIMMILIQWLKLFSWRILSTLFSASILFYKTTCKRAVCLLPLHFQLWRWAIVASLAINIYTLSCMRVFAGEQPNMNRKDEILFLCISQLSCSKYFGNDHTHYSALNHEWKYCRFNRSTLDQTRHLWPLKPFSAMFIKLMSQTFKCILPLDTLLAVWNWCAGYSCISSEQN